MDSANFALQCPSVRLLRQVNSPMSNFDDLTIIRLERKFRQSHPYLKILYNSPDLSYLNLINYELSADPLFYKLFLRNALTELLSCKKNAEVFYACAPADIIYYFVMHLEDISTKTENASTLDRRFKLAVNYMKDVKTLKRMLLIYRVIEFYRTCSPENLEVLFAFVKHFCFSRVTKEYALRFLLHHNVNSNFARKFLKLAAERRFDFWSMWERNCNISTVPFCPVTEEFFYGSLKHLQVLMDYGFRKNHYGKHTIREILMSRYGFHMVTWLKEIISPISQNSRNSVVHEMLLFFCMICPIRRSGLDLVKCFRLIWDARKEPFVTREELIDAYDSKLGNHSQDGGRIVPRSFFLRILNGFQRILNDYKWQTLQPRSLKHLCRCTIREALNDSWQMPHGVENLPLPRRMKSYILLKTTLNSITGII